MTDYSNFAFYYDELTQNVDYQMMADYYVKLFQYLKHEPGLTLDMACGTGNLTFALLERGIDVFGLDASPEMLAQAKDKAYDKELDILFINQKMQNLDLYSTVDTVVSALDSINHLKKPG